MSEYEDAKGDEYALQPGYTTGDLVILSEDKAAWKVDSSVMIDARHVQHLIWQEGNAAPDLKRHQLDAFIRALHDDQPAKRISFTKASPTIELLRRYECAVAAQQCLYRSVKELKYDELYSAFVLCSQIEHFPSACRVILQGYKWYRRKDTNSSSPPSLCPDDQTRIWTADDVVQIRSTWMWALTVATQKIGGRLAEQSSSEEETEDEGSSGSSSTEEDDSEGRRLWRDFAGEFMACLFQ